MNDVADVNARSRAAGNVGMALCALLFCVPFMLRVALDAGGLGLANEPLAYRFFYSELIFAGIVLIPALLARGSGRREVVRRSLLAALGFGGAFFAVHLASYLGNFRPMLTAMRAWWSLVLNPGGEPALWGNLIGGFVQNYNYGYLALYSACMRLFVIAGMLVRLEADSRTIPARLSRIENVA